MTESETYKELGILTKDKDKWKESIPYVSSFLAYDSVKIQAKALWLLGEMGLIYSLSVQDVIPVIVSRLTAPAGSLYTGKCCPGKFAPAKRRAAGISAQVLLFSVLRITLSKISREWLNIERRDSNEEAFSPDFSGGDAAELRPGRNRGRTR